MNLHEHLGEVFGAELNEVRVAEVDAGRAQRVVIRVKGLGDSPGCKTQVPMDWL